MSTIMVEHVGLYFTIKSEINDFKILDCSV